jgi:hypothetical protein
VLLIGGVIGLEWSHGVLPRRLSEKMLAKNADAPAAAVPAAPSSTTLTPSLGAPIGYLRSGELAEGDKSASKKTFRKAASKPLKREETLFLDAGQGGHLKVEREEASNYRLPVGTAGTAAAAKPAHHAHTSYKKDPAGPLLDRGSATPKAGARGRSAHEEEAANALEEPPAQLSSPPPKAAELSPPPAPPAEPASPAPAASPARSSVQQAQAAEKPVPTTPDALARRVEEQASSGRCDESIQSYRDLEKSYPAFRISPKTRAEFVRCLRVLGSYQPENQLDEAAADEPNLLRMQHAVKGKKSAPPRAATPARAPPSKAAK